MAAVNLAWERNNKAVEIDAQLSKDNRLVVFHDSNTLRLGRKFRRVDSQTLTELKKLDVGISKGKEFTGEKIPALEEVFESIPSGARLFVEIKGKKTVTGQLKKLLLEFPNLNISFIAFDFKVLKDVRNNIPGYECYLIVEKKLFNSNNSVIDKSIAKCKSAGLQGLDLDFRLLKSKSDADRIKNAGLKLFTWTVDDAETAKKLCEWKIDGITTNRGEWLKNELLKI